jgi:hypothetical protein
MKIAGLTFVFAVAAFFAAAGQQPDKEPVAGSASVHNGGGQARFEPIPEQARVVKQVFEWIARDRCSLGEVCRRLQKTGERTQSGKSIRISFRTNAGLFVPLSKPFPAASLDLLGQTLRCGFVRIQAAAALVRLAFSRGKPSFDPGHPAFSAFEASLAEYRSSLEVERDLPEVLVELGFLELFAGRAKKIK